MVKSILRNKVTGKYFTDVGYTHKDTCNIKESLSFIDLNVVFPYNFDINSVINNYDIVSYDNELRKLKLIKLKNK